MTSLLPKTVNRRKTCVVMMHAEIFRERGAGEWKLRIRCGGLKSRIYETHTSILGAAKLFATCAIRDLSAPRPAVSSQQPAASSQQQTLI